MPYIPLPQILSGQLMNILINISLFIVVTVSIRYLVAWFVNTLAGSGVISYSARTLIIKVLDILVISAIIVVSIHLITASLTPYIVATIIGVLTFVIFYYEIKEFTAFITVHLQKFTKGAWIEILIPRIECALKGRIVDVQLFNSVLEDIHGNRTYIANSLLVNSIIREYKPKVYVKIKLNGLNSDDELVGLDTKIMYKVKEASAELPFRLEESKTFVESIANGSVTFAMELIPLSIPVRASDITKLAKYLINHLREYNPEIKVRLE